MTQETSNTKTEEKQREGMRAPRSGPGTVSLVCGILGVVAPFIIPMAGMVLSPLFAIVAIVTGCLALSTGKGRAGLILGIFDFLLFVGFVMPSSSFFQQDRMKESRVKEQMHKIQLSLLDFYNEAVDTLYPTSMSDTTAKGRTYKSFADELQVGGDLKNVWTGKPVNIEFEPRIPPSPLIGEDTILTKGDIRIYCDGHKFLVVGGGRKNTVLSLTLTNY